MLFQIFYVGYIKSTYDGSFFFTSQQIRFDLYLIQADGLKWLEYAIVLAQISSCLTKSFFVSVEMDCLLLKTQAVYEPGFNLVYSLCSIVGQASMMESLARLHGISNPWSCRLMWNVLDGSTM